MSASSIKYVLTAIGLALVLSSAAEAARKRMHRPQIGSAHAARSAGHAPVVRASPPVVFGDRVIGADPDPRIRHQLLRDLGAVFGGTD